MIQHINSQLITVDDEFTYIVGLRGMSGGTIKECAIQVSKEADKQDIALNLDGAYLTYNAEGDYGLISSISIEGSKSIKLVVDQQVACDQGFDLEDLLFDFEIEVSEVECGLIERIAEIGNIAFIIK